jgi:23S rRNA pseudouridine1911/1915/1917 synthase
MHNASDDMVNNIGIIYEDTDVVVINKPSGLIVHSDGRNDEPTVCDWVLSQYPQTAGVGEPWTSPQGEVIARPGIVHRLDRVTSGVLIIAKTQEAHAFLKNQFQNRTLKKVYRAFVYGQPKQDSGIIEAEIGRSRSTPKIWSAQFGASGTKRAAITEWTVLGRGEDPTTGEMVSYIEARPKTGRTHQIRVHFKAIHHPIICDHIYAVGKPCLLGFERLALHSFQLEAALPSGETRTFEAPLPPEFEHALSAFQGQDLSR